MAQVNEQQKVTVELTIAECNVILAALGKQPLEAVFGVFSSLREQIDRQLNYAPAPV